MGITLKKYLKISYLKKNRMGYILCLETATQVCSIALCKDGSLIAKKESDVPNAHSSVLSTFIQEIFRESGIGMEELDAVAVSKGPGSYTGLRIGVSTAKGLCYGREIPLISIPTLESLTAGAIAADSSADLYCPMIDAKRMEVYTALFDNKGKEVAPTEARIIEDHSFTEYLKDKRMLFFGDGAAKCRQVLTHPNAFFNTEIQASAAHMARLVQRKYESSDFEDNAYFEPYYLKDFVAGKPRIKGLFD
jgi:tRNA threonylcarbamoyladenosine biosynthesis protein TsaB